MNRYNVTKKDIKIMRRNGIVLDKISVIETVVCAERELRTWAYKNNYKIKHLRWAWSND